MLLLVDQFEELFTLCEDEPMRHAFIDALLAAIQAPEVSCSLLLTLRADFYGRCADYALRTAISDRQVLVGALTADELRQAIKAPVDRVARDGRPTFEDGLVEQIVADAGSGEGSLPLVQYCLGILWDSNALTLGNYRQIGGVQGALQRRADTLYDVLPVQERAVMRWLLTRLVLLGDGKEDTRRRVRLSDLSRAGEIGDVTTTLIRRLANERLLTITDNVDLATGATVEVAHEALIRGWPRLRGWLEEDREGLRTRSDIAQATTRWVSLQHDQGALLRGQPLVSAEQWVANHPHELTSPEEEFLTISRQVIAEETERQQRDQQEQLRQAQALAEAERKRVAEGERANKRLRGFLAALVVVLLILAGSVWFALNSQAQAQQRALEARSQSLVAGARAANIQNDSEMARALAQANLMLLLETATPGSALQRPFQESAGALSVAAYTPGTRVLLSGHSDSVTSVAVDRGGTRAVTGSSDGTVRIWQLPSDRAGAITATHIISASSAAVNSVAVNPLDPAIALAGDSQGKVQWWNVQTGQNVLLNTKAGPQHAIHHVVFSPDGILAAAGGDDGRLYLWRWKEAGDGQTLPTSQHEPLRSGITSIAFTPDGRYVLAGSSDTTIHAWRIADGVEVFQLIGHGDEVSSIAMHPNGAVLLSGSYDTTLRLWMLPSNLDAITETLSITMPAATISPGVDYITSVAFSPDGQMLAFGSYARVVWTAPFDPANIGQLSFHDNDRLIGHRANITELAFLPDGRQLLSSADDRTARLWEVQPGYEEGRLPGSTISLAASSDGRSVLVGGWRTLSLWDVTTRRKIQTAAFQEADCDDTRKEKGYCWIRKLALNRDNTLALTTDIDGLLRVWDVTTGQIINRPLVTTPTCSVNGKGSGDHVMFARGVAFSPVDSALALIASGTYVHLWNLKTFEEVGCFKEHKGAAWEVAFSPDGSKALTASFDHTVGMWNIVTKQKSLVKGHADWAMCVAYSSDGAHFASGSKDGEIRLWDAQGTYLRSFIGHTGEVQAVAFVDQDRYLVSDSLDRTVRVWDVTTGIEIRRFRYKEDGGTVKLAPLPHTPFIAATDANNADGGVRIWRLDLTTPGLLAWVKKNRYVPVLTADQCRQYSLDTTSLCAEALRSTL